MFPKTFAKFVVLFLGHFKPTVYLIQGFLRSGKQKKTSAHDAMTRKALFSAIGAVKREGGKGRLHLGA